MAARKASQTEPDPVADEAYRRRLWDLLKKTDPKHTKPFRRSGFSGTQIDPTWRYQRLTEVFGPCGQGWGYELGEPIIVEGMVFIAARLWWKDDDGDVCWTGWQYGGDVLFKTRKDGPPVPNDEAVKMAVTDAVGKAAVLLGLGADIHLGQYDDSKYRGEVEQHFEAERAKQEAAEREAKAGPVKEEVAEAIAQLKEWWEAENWKAYDKGVHERLKSLYSRAVALCPNEAQGLAEQMQAFVTSMKAALQPQKEAAE